MMRRRLVAVVMMRSIMLNVWMAVECIHKLWRPRDCMGDAKLDSCL